MRVTCIYSTCRHGGEQAISPKAATCDVCRARWAKEEVEEKSEASADRSRRSLAHRELLDAEYSGGVLHHIHALEQTLKESIAREQELARQLGEAQDSPCAGCRESVDRATTAEAERDVLVSRAGIAEAKVAAFERLTDHANETFAECHRRAEKAERERDEAQQALALSVAAWDAAGMQGRDTATVIGVLLAEIDRFRAALAEWPIREAHFRDELRSSSGKCGRHIPGHHGGSCSLPEGHSGFCEE